jgi:hypothetical protein
MIHRPSRGASQRPERQPEPTSSSGHDRRSYTTARDTILSHALVSEIALDCGYPASPLKEGVYALSDPSNPGQVNRCGILIYIATGGSFGTLAESRRASITLCVSVLRALTEIDRRAHGVGALKGILPLSGSTFFRTISNQRSRSAFRPEGGWGFTAIVSMRRGCTWRLASVHTRVGDTRWPETNNAHARIRLHGQFL